MLVGMSIIDGKELYESFQKSSDTCTVQENMAGLPFHKRRNPPKGRNNLNHLHKHQAGANRLAPFTQQGIKVV